jgi:hypothetical protein
MASVIGRIRIQWRRNRQSVAAMAASSASIINLA